MSDKAISAFVQDGGYPAFTPERPEPADLGKDYAGNGKPHDARTNHIKQGGAMHPDKATKESR
jgi:hypothetical protein